MNRPVSCRILLPALLCCFPLFVSCVFGPPPGSPETGYAITGFVGESPETPASSVQVVLLDGETDKPLDAVTTNFFGKYTFSRLPPGLYVLQVRDIQWAVLLKDRSERLDIDLSAPGGKMDYASHHVKKAMAESKKSEKAAGSPAKNDPQLAGQIAGKYWGYSGASSSSGGGGTERRYWFCPGGSFYDGTESSYYGTSSDQYGNADMSWGAGGQRSDKASWSVQGTAQKGTITISYPNGKTSQIVYEATGEKGCYRFNGSTLCYTGPCD